MYKVFNEHLEKRVGELVMRNLEAEKRMDGVEAYVVKNLEGLIADITDFIEVTYVKKNPEEEGVAEGR